VPRLATLRLPLFALLLAALIAATVLQPYRNKPPIRSDGVGYHIWTHALLGLDLRFCQLAERAGAAGAISVRNPVSGVCQNKYPPGVALLRLPFMAPFALGQLEADPGQPLITRWEHRMSLALGAAALLLTALFCFWTLRRLAVSPGTAQWALFFAVLGTGLFHYGTYDSSFSHVYSAFLLAMLLWLLLGRTDRTHGWAARAALAVGALLLVLVRNTNVLLVGLAAVAGASARGWGWPSLPPLAAGTAAGVAIQLGYNALATGTLALSSYGAERFVWDRPMWASVLLSYERGLFTYYPVVAVALAAGLIVRETRRAALLLGALVVAVALLYGFWDSWYLGGGFGHRGFVELVPAVALLLGVALDRMSPRARRTTIVACLVATCATAQLMWGYWRRTLPFEHADGPLYWAHLWGPFGLPARFHAGFVALAAAALVAVLSGAFRGRARPDGPPGEGRAGSGRMR
jgi:hypothetical protein